MILVIAQMYGVWNLSIRIILFCCDGIDFSKLMAMTSNISNATTDTSLSFDVSNVSVYGAYTGDIDSGTRILCYVVQSEIVASSKTSDDSEASTIYQYCMDKQPWNTDYEIGVVDFECESVAYSAIATSNGGIICCRVRTSGADIISSGIETGFLWVQQSDAPTDENRGEYSSQDTNIKSTNVVWIIFIIVVAFCKQINQDQTCTSLAII